MKIILTENQIEFIRRYEKIKELVDNGIDVLNQQEDLCDYTYSEFLTEVCWQVSDNGDSLYLPDGMIDEIHRWVRNHFGQHIRKEFDRVIDDHNCDEGFDDADEDYLSGLMFGTDNIQESMDDDEYYHSLRVALRRRHDKIMEEMHHFIENNLDCDDPYDWMEDSFVDYILEEVTDAMMYTYGVDKWEWPDLNDEIRKIIGGTIKSIFISWATKNC